MFHLTQNVWFATLALEYGVRSVPDRFWEQTSSIHFSSTSNDDRGTHIYVTTTSDHKRPPPTPPILSGVCLVFCLLGEFFGLQWWLCSWDVHLTIDLWDPTLGTCVAKKMCPSNKVTRKTVWQDFEPRKRYCDLLQYHYQIIILLEGWYARFPMGSGKYIRNGPLTWLVWCCVLRLIFQLCNMWKIPSSLVDPLIILKLQLDALIYKVRISC